MKTRRRNYLSTDVPTKKEELLENKATPDINSHGIRRKSNVKRITNSEKRITRSTKGVYSEEKRIKKDMKRFSPKKVKHKNILSNKRKGLSSGVGSKIIKDTKKKKNIDKKTDNDFCKEQMLLLEKEESGLKAVSDKEDEHLLITDKVEAIDDKDSSYLSEKHDEKEDSKSILRRLKETEQRSRTDVTEKCRRNIDDENYSLEDICSKKQVKKSKDDLYPSKILRSLLLEKSSKKQKLESDISTKKSNDSSKSNFELASNLSIKRKSINEKNISENLNYFAKYGEKGKKSPKKSRQSEEIKNSEKDGVTNDENKTNLDNANTEDKIFNEDQKQLRNDVFVKDKKLGSSEKEIKNIDKLENARNKKINIQGIIIEEIDKFEVHQKDSKENNTDSNLSEISEPKDRIQHATLVNSDKFSDDKRLVSSLKQTLTEAQKKESNFNEIDNENCKKVGKVVQTKDDSTAYCNQLDNFKNEEPADKMDRNESHKKKLNELGLSQEEKNKFKKKDPERLDERCQFNKDLKEDINDIHEVEINELIDEDSDSSPEELTFQNSRNIAMCSLKDAENETRRLKFQKKEFQRKYQERNILQKEEKRKRILELESKKLPQNILNDLSKLSKIEQAHENIKEVMPKKFKFCEENEDLHASSNCEQEEFISIHGGTEFKVCKLDNFVKKQDSIAESTKNWKQCLLFGNKNKRESVKEMLSKTVKQSVSGKSLSTQRKEF